MALTDSLRILITANGAQAEREFAKVGAASRKSLGQAESSTQRWGRTLTSAGVAMATFGGVALVGLAKAAQAAQEEDLQIAKLNNTIANSPELAGASADAFLDQAAALQDTTKFADDATIAAQAMLGTFHLTQDEVLGLTPLVQDLAAKFDTDLVTAAKQVGKAMQGNVGALQRNGVEIDEAAFATDRYSAVLTALRENAGGFAEEEGQTFNGQLEILKNNLGDVAEGLGRGVVTAFNTMLGPVQSLSDRFTDLDPAMQATVGAIAAFGSAGLVVAGGTLFLGGQILKLGRTFTALKETALGARLATVAMNPAFLSIAGLAAVAGAALTANFIVRSQEAEERVRAFTQALEDQQQGMEGAVRETIASTVATDDFLSRYDEFGATAQDVAAAINGNGEAFDRVRGNVEEYMSAFDSRSDAAAFNDATFASGSFVQQIERQRDALSQARGDAQLHSAVLDELGGTTEEAADATDRLDTATQRLGDTWSAISDRLGDFNAALSQQDALQTFRDNLREANKEGGIGRREFTGLGRDLSGLVESYVSVAESQNTAADGTVNYQGRNRQLRRDLGALAAFIPASLRPQFQFLTQDILGIPTGHHTELTLHGTAVVDDAINGLDRLRGAILDTAIAYNSADLNRANALTGRGGGGDESIALPRSSGRRRGSTATASTPTVQPISAAELARELIKGGGLPVYVVNS